MCFIIISALLLLYLRGLQHLPDGLHTWRWAACLDWRTGKRLVWHTRTQTPACRDLRKHKQAWDTDIWQMFLFSSKTTPMDWRGVLVWIIFASAIKVYICGWRLKWPLPVYRKDFNFPAEPHHTRWPLLLNLAKQGEMTHIPFFQMIQIQKNELINEKNTHDEQQFYLQAERESLQSQQCGSW